MSAPQPPREPSAPQPPREPSAPQPVVPEPPRARSLVLARAPRQPPPPDQLAGAYAGFVTRAIAFALDAVAINIVALLVGAVTALAVNILHVPTNVAQLVAVVSGAVFLLWSAVYFVTFWSTTGQTPGARIMHLRVVDARDGVSHIPPRRALLRAIAMVIAAIPLFAGYLLVLVDDRRRGLHDRIARTVVLYDDSGAGPHG